MDKLTHNFSIAGQEYREITPSRMIAISPEKKNISQCSDLSLMAHQSAINVDC